MKTLLNQRFDKKNTILLACIILFIVSSIAFIQNQAGDSIVGTWVSVDDPNNKWIYTEDQKAKSYYDGELLDTYTYRISTSSPECGVNTEVHLQKHPDISILVVTNQSDGDENCYYITTLDNENLSLAPFGKGGFITFERQ